MLVANIQDEILLYLNRSSCLAQIYHWAIKRTRVKKVSAHNLHTVSALNSSYSQEDNFWRLEWILVW